MMGNYGMGPGMMGGHGYGMGPNRMGKYGMGPGMMGGYGYGMGPNMMGNYGMGPGMMGGYGYAPNQPGYDSQDKYRKFLDDTMELRKKLHDLNFEYSELLRDTKTTTEARKQLEKKIFDLQRKIQEQAVK
jgi:hypothetical protein